MVELLALLIIVIIVGALAGGNSFGEVVRTGFGCLGLLIVLAVIGVVVLLAW